MTGQYDPHTVAAEVLTAQMEGGARVIALLRGDAPDLSHILDEEGNESLDAAELVAAVWLAFVESLSADAPERDLLPWWERPAAE